MCSLHSDSAEEILARHKRRRHISGMREIITKTPRRILTERRSAKHRQLEDELTSDGEPQIDEHFVEQYELLPCGADLLPDRSDESESNKRQRYYWQDID